uniref:WAPL cohesin release factor a n=1 Tax=Eptatretus burgeri TaxID=7764 RepID=A0A8C4QA61_EPTBU
MEATTFVLQHLDQWRSRGTKRSALIGYLEITRCGLGFGVCEGAACLAAGWRCEVGRFFFPPRGRVLPPTTMASRFPRTYSRKQGTPGAFASKFDELLGPRRPIAPGPAIAASSAGPPAACAPILPVAPAEAAAPSKRRRMEPCARGTAERNSSHNDGVAEGRASPDGPATASATHVQSLASRLAVYEPCSSDEENEECNGVSQHDLWSLSRRGRRGTQKMKAWNLQKKLDEDKTKDVFVGFENATKCNSFVSGIGKDRSTAHKRQNSATKNSSWSCLEERMAAEPGEGFAHTDTRVDCNDEDLWDRMRAKAEPLVCESKSLDSEVISLLGETGIKPAECVMQWNSTTEKASGLSKLGIWGIARKEDGDVTEGRFENYYVPRSKKDNFDLSDNLLNRKRLMVQPTETEGEDGRISFRSSNCRTYERVRRLDASFEGGDSTRTPLCSTVNSKEQLLFLKTSMQACRDPTTLPATSVSPVGVTLQDVRDLPQVPSGPATIASKDGEARNICLESAMAPRPLRTPRSSAASYRNRKREAMLDFFGFDEADGDGESGDSSERPAPCAAYKLKYFGFDEIVGEETETSVDSGSEVPSTHSDTFAAAGRRDAGGGYSPDSSRASPTQPVCDFWSDSQDFSSNMSSSQETEVLEIRDEQITVQELQVDQHRLPEKRRDDVKKKIFHSPRKPIGKAVYNARHWTQHKMETELELPELLRIASAPAWLDYKERVQESKEATKDADSQLDKASGMVDEKDASAKQLFNAGLQEVFKAPSLPPRLVKKIAFPSNPDDEMVTSLKCHKDDKELYTVVRQVKAFNEVLEFGETQEFSDDVEYLLSGLKPEQPVNIRCLSTVSLAMKCAMPSFRMHLRAHGMVVKLFRLLSDAQEDQNLALCTAALMYVLSRDRLNMDLDRGCLELLIRLLELDPAGGADGSGTGGDVGMDSGESREGQRHRERIRKLCERVHDRHLDLENITTAHLAMETLLSLTSRRAGDWFKEELRLLGGLDHIIDKVTECGRKFTEEVEDDELVVALRGAERCLRVLESVTVHNPENQVYLIAYSDSQLVVSTARVLCFCEKETRRRGQITLDTQVGFTPPPVHYKGGPTFQSRSASPVAKALEGCLRAAFGVLLNLTNNNGPRSTG